MVSISGPSGAGKTTLVRETFFDDIENIHLFFHPTSTQKGVIEVLRAELCRISRANEVPVFETLIDGIAYVLALTRRQRIRLILDGVDCAARIEPNFLGALQELWEKNRQSTQCLLVLVTESHIALQNRALENLLLEADAEIEVHGWTANELAYVFREIHPEGGNLDLLTLYAISGGLPGVVHELGAAKSYAADDLIDYVFSDKGAGLREMPEVFLLRDLRLTSNNCHELLRGVAAGQTRWSQLQDRVSEPATPYLSRLIGKYGLLEKRYPLLHHSSKSSVRYVFKDGFFRFWYAMVDAPELTVLAAQSDWKGLKAAASVRMNSFLAETMRQWFLDRYIDQARYKMEVGAWWNHAGTATIDIVAIDRSQKIIEFAQVENTGDQTALRLAAAKFLEQHPAFAGFERRFRILTLDDMQNPIF
ncbi:MAG: hypothetical protein Q4E62_06355 [Sutterellaceae bacterium]|nr:hypothetical protein [Sutterellaceae bacterium]